MCNTLTVGVLASLGFSHFLSTRSLLFDVVSCSLFHHIVYKFSAFFTVGVDFCDVDSQEIFRNMKKFFAGRRDET